MKLFQHVTMLLHPLYHTPINVPFMIANRCFDECYKLEIINISIHVPCLKMFEHYLNDSLGFRSKPNHPKYQ